MGTLDELLAPLIAWLAERPDATARSVAEERSQGEQLQAEIRRVAYAPPPQGVTTKDHLVEVEGTTIPCRAYHPPLTAPLPIHCYLHGGAFFLGSIDGSDTACRELAIAAGAIVVSVGYRLAPEHPFPTAAEDAYRALCWIASHEDLLGGRPGALSIGGESAGANLAAVVALLARDRGGPPLALQVLSIPVTDFTMRSGSIEEFASGYLLTKAALLTARERYLDGHDPTDPYCSPLLAADLHELPPAVVTTMEFDPLRDEGEAYAMRLVSHGVPVRLRRFLGHVHGSAMFTAILPSARDYYRYLGDAMRAAYASWP